MKAKFALPTNDQLWALIDAAISKSRPRGLVAQEPNAKRVASARRKLNDLGRLLERLNEYKTVREILRQVGHPDWEA